MCCLHSAEHFLSNRYIASFVFISSILFHFIPFSVCLLRVFFLLLFYILSLETILVHCYFVYSVEKSEIWSNEWHHIVFYFYFYTISYFTNCYATHDYIGFKTIEYFQEKKTKLDLFKYSWVLFRFSSFVVFFSMECTIFVASIWQSSILTNIQNDCNHFFDGHLNGSILTIFLNRKKILHKKILATKSKSRVHCLNNKSSDYIEHTHRDSLSESERRNERKQFT